MRVFITGGTGFIGHYVARELLQSGHEVVILTRHPDKIPSLANHSKVKILVGTIYDAATISKGLEGCDACIHIALGWGETPLSMLENDTRATVLILQAASKAGCKKFIYTSSTAAMGKFRSVMNENVINLPIDLYGATKAAGEAYVLGFRGTSMKRNIIRPGYTFGNPAFGEDGVTQPDKRFALMAQAIVNNGEIHLIKNDGTQFISAADQAKLFHRVLDSDFNEEIYLGLSTNWISWRSIAERMFTLYESIAHKKSSAKIVEQDLGWSDHPMLFSVEKIASVFGLSFDAKSEMDKHIEWQLKAALAIFSGK
jgi:UDP-glucose 4-epimerase